MRQCLDIDVPFGTRHPFMGTHNRRLRLGAEIYLEIIACDPEAPRPSRSRWFGLDDPDQVRRDWEEGRRLRGWVARTGSMGALLAEHGEIFGEHVPLPDEAPEFSFAIPADGSLPLGGAAPSVIDHHGDTRFVQAIPDFGARLETFRLATPDPDTIDALFRRIGIAGAPEVTQGREMRYSAGIRTPSGFRELT